MFNLCTLYLYHFVDYNYKEAGQSKRKSFDKFKGVHTLLQMVIATVLMMVLFFGIGFILNMLMKTTWFPLYAFLALVVGVVIYGSVGTASASFLSSDASFTIVDIVPAIGGLAGAILSGSAIKALRIRGFKMF
ncbi:hypothetical protein GCM10008018_22520 [Paenibacillus marchantiophytorum]|uniref:Uncharacterized protein n=1 Tax=Paenibacillus marchantiophytorum TaxID=1619310 RepID=A0ABQ1ELF6_9BACL|nr:YuiB family protein [Paenibacillus marchantiophytorum]GFZ76581.1 hypothetical protein GCM10008018_22520 [Paenibacillus marchantiophytorum]